MGERTSSDAQIAASTREARAVRGCQVLRQQLAAAEAKLARLREDYGSLARWAGQNAEDNPFAEQVCWHAKARLAEWDLPLERWEP